MKALWNFSFKIHFLSDFKQISHGYYWHCLSRIIWLEFPIFSCHLYNTYDTTSFLQSGNHFSCQWFTLLHYSSIIAQNTLYSQYQRNTQCSENLTKAVQISPRAATSCLIAVDVCRNSYRSINIFTFALYFFVKLYFQFNSIE